MKVFDKMPTTITRRTKVISGVIVITSATLAVWSIFPKLWFWIAWEVLGAALVAYGCFGEWRIAAKWPTKTSKQEEHKREVRYIALVTIGVVMELIGLAHAIPEAVRLAKDVALANSRAEAARVEAANANLRAAITESNNLVLELEIAQTKTNVATINPINLPIKSMLAQVSLMICATNLVVHETDREIALFGGFMELYNDKGHSIGKLSCTEFNNTSVAWPPGEPSGQRVFSMRFGWPSNDKLLSMIDNFSTLHFSTASFDKDMGAAGGILFKVPELAAPFKTCGGSVTLTINGSIERRFKVPSHSNKLFLIDTNRPPDAFENLNPFHR